MSSSTLHPLMVRPWNTFSRWKGAKQSGVRNSKRIKVSCAPEGFRDYKQKVNDKGYFKNCYKISRSVSRLTLYIFYIMKLLRLYPNMSLYSVGTTGLYIKPSPMNISTIDKYVIVPFCLFALSAPYLASLRAVVLCLNLRCRWILPSGM